MSDEKIISLDANRPHVVIECDNGNVHVYPMAYFHDLIAGKPVEPLPDEVLRSIVAQWVEFIPLIDEFSESSA